MEETTKCGWCTRKLAFALSELSHCSEMSLLLQKHVRHTRSRADPWPNPHEQTGRRRLWRALGYVNSCKHPHHQATTWQWTWLPMFSVKEQSGDEWVCHARMLVFRLRSQKGLSPFLANVGASGRGFTNTITQPSFVTAWVHPNHGLLASSVMPGTGVHLSGLCMLPHRCKHWVTQADVYRGGEG